MNLIWGCKPMLYTGELPRGGVFDTALEIAVKSGLLKNGDTVVSALGMPLGFSGATNTLRVDIVGDVLCKGKGDWHEKGDRHSQSHYRKGRRGAHLPSGGHSGDNGNGQQLYALYP